jgi:hypothetical protein
MTVPQSSPSEEMAAVAAIAPSVETSPSLETAARMEAATPSVQTLARQAKAVESKPELKREASRELQAYARPKEQAVRRTT